MDEGMHRSPGQVFGERLRELRDLRQMSAQKLSERLIELGVEVSRDSISKLENDPDRAAAVRLETVLAIAVVLNCSPTWLITPSAHGQRVSVTPNLSAPSGAIRGWLRGYWPLAGADPMTFFRAMPPREYAALLEEARKAPEDAGLPAPMRYALTIAEEDR